MKIAVLSPYALSRPGGVQGQVVGLAAALVARGHAVTVLAPDDEGPIGPHSDGSGVDRFVIGPTTAVRSNGSVAPVTLSPLAAARVRGVVRRGGFDVLHAHEPLAPVAAYGCLVAPPLPMIGTYHRAGVSRWVPVLKPLATMA
ncbi:MAG TPA: glycosyltransferase, partial [Acidimicrobiales bacterium]|nr:glycosyltransferase [Acidimicrobiales bacterium]